VGEGVLDSVSKQRGFTLIELLTTTAIIAIVAGMGMPLLAQIGNSITLGEAARQVERELQSARLTAVSANQPIRVRFNCPAAGQYRQVELIGTPTVPTAADGAIDRCNAVTYPFPATDNNPITRPNNDGPLRYLNSTVTFQTATTIEFWPDGTAHTNTAGTNPWPSIASSGTSIVLLRNGQTKSILVNGVGKIQLVP
jgi:prepilin-type N-terminal cleavage/methylation domain-containing protein